MTATSKLFTLAAVVVAAVYRRRNRVLAVALARKESNVQVFAEIARRQIQADYAAWESEMGGAA